MVSRICAFCIVVLAVSHTTSSISAQQTFEAENNFRARVEKGLGKLIKDNNYFQASEQVFNLYECPPVTENIVEVVREEKLNVTKKTPRVLPEGYFLVKGGGAFKLNNTRTTWTVARRTCIAEGAHLATIDTEAEAAYLKNFTLTNRISAWIGLHDLFEKFEWTDIFDVPFNKTGMYPSWRRNEPNNYNDINERCIEYGIRKDFGLNDLPCESTLKKELRPFFCKIKMD